MKLFHWYSYAIAGYFPGDVIVAAEDIEEARRLACEGLAEYCNLKETDDDLKEQIEHDISHTPNIIDAPGTICIRSNG